MTERIDADREAGAVFVGRGAEQHGVPMTGTPDVQDDWADETHNDGRVPVMQPAPEDVRPIPVVVVHEPQDVSHYDKKWRSAQYTLQVGTQPVQIAWKSRERTKLKIKNFSGDYMFIGPTPELATPAWGFVMQGGEIVDIVTDDAVWACPNTGVAAVIVVHCLYEYDLKITP